MLENWSRMVEPCSSALEARWSDPQSTVILEGESVPGIFALDPDPEIGQQVQRAAAGSGLAAWAFSTVEQLLAEYRPGLTACLVLELCPPEISRLEVQAELERRHSELTTLFLSARGRASQASSMWETPPHMRHSKLEVLLRNEPVRHVP